MVFSLSGEYLGPVVLFHKHQPIVLYVNKLGVDYVVTLRHVHIVCPD